MFKIAGHSLDMESDLELAREAAPGLIKTVDGLVLVSPENRTLLELSAQAYCSYAFGFLEDDLEALPQGDPREDGLRTRAAALYHRCQDYGARLLQLTASTFPDALHHDAATLAAAVAKVQDRDDVPGLFWTGLGLASEINLRRDDTDLLAELPKAEVLLQRSIALDETYYNGGAHLALGLLYASQPRAIGGDPEKGRRELERAIVLTGGKFLLHRVMLARAYAVAVQDRPLYEKTLVDVYATRADVMPEQRLANEIARRKAQRYLKQAGDLF
jgi:hypothetical protein